MTLMGLKLGMGLASKPCFAASLSFFCQDEGKIVPRLYGSEESLCSCWLELLGGLEPRLSFVFLPVE